MCLQLLGMVLYQRALIVSILQIRVQLEINKCLKVFDLHTTFITSYGAILLLASMAKNATLQRLDLSNNVCHAQRYHTVVLLVLGIMVFVKTKLL